MEWLVPIGAILVLLIARTGWRSMNTRANARAVVTAARRVEGSNRPTPQALDAPSARAVANKIDALLDELRHEWRSESLTLAHGNLADECQAVVDEGFDLAQRYREHGIPAAIWRELSEPARMLLAERRKADPEYTFGKALNELIEDPVVMDRVERKTGTALTSWELPPSTEELSGWIARRDELLARIRTPPRGAS